MLRRRDESAAAVEIVAILGDSTAIKIQLHSKGGR
jgi:hypothetical protein